MCLLCSFVQVHAGKGLVLPKHSIGKWLEHRLLQDQVLDKVRCIGEEEALIEGDFEVYGGEVDDAEEDGGGRASLDAKDGATSLDNLHFARDRLGLCKFRHVIAKPINLTVRRHLLPNSSQSFGADCTP